MMGIKLESVYKNQVTKHENITSLFNSKERIIVPAIKKNDHDSMKSEEESEE